MNAHERRAEAVRLLIVADSTATAARLAARFAGAGRDVMHQCVGNAQDLKEALRGAEWSAVIFSMTGADCTAADVLQLLRQGGRHIPLLVEVAGEGLAASANGRGDGAAADRVREWTGGRRPDTGDGLPGARAAGAVSAPVNLVHLSDYDRVTGLPWHDLFMRQAAQQFATAGAGAHFAVCIIELAGWSRMPAVFGDALADEVLAQLARRLKAVAPQALVCRYAADKFALVCGGFASLQSVQVFAADIVDRLAEACDSNGLQLHLAAGMGVSVYPEDGTGVAQLMLRAETALHQCRQLLGRNGFLFYFKGMDANAAPERVLERALSDASAMPELFLLFQPIVDLDGGSVRAMEALVRWQHPEFGLLPPGRFVPLAGRRGVMGRLGEWVFAEACREARAWQAAGVTGFGVSVNVSASEFNHQDLPGSVLRALRASQLAPDLLTIEIAESVLMRDVDVTLNTLRILKKMGVRIAIDDFGTGHSSLSYLKQYPIDVLKMDQSFVNGIDRDARDAVIAKAIIDLGHSLGLQVFAKGVDTPAQAAFLRAHGCDCAQGRFFGEPLPPAEVPACIAGRAGSGPRLIPR